MDLKLLNEYKQTPMGKPETMLLLKLLTDPVDPARVAESIAMLFSCRLIESRLKAVTAPQPLQIDPRVVLFLGMPCTTPCEAALYAHTIKELAVRNKGALSLEDMAYKFPNGFPDRAEMQQAWDAQKQGTHMGGNYLDTPEAWQHG